MLTELCKELNNWFDMRRIFGEFKIVDGKLVDASKWLQDGQYFRIVGSIFNDGVYKYTEEMSDLADEFFDGALWTMAVPPSVIELAQKIQDWQDRYGGIDSEAMSPYQSESFGGYSYQKKSGGSSSSGIDISTSWKAAFAAELAKWRKIRP